jgi:HlyD family secretion protein
MSKRVLDSLKLALIVLVASWAMLSDRNLSNAAALERDITIETHAGDLGSVPKKSSEVNADTPDVPNEADVRSEEDTPEDKEADSGDQERKDEASKSLEAESDAEIKNDANGSDKKEAKSKEKDSPKSQPFSVAAKSLEIEAELDGLFVAAETEEVAIRPEVWTRFVVKEAVDHGTEVRKGEVLIKFDDEKLEQDLAQEAINQRLEELALMSANEEHPREVKLLELKHQEAKRRYDQLVEDHRYYLEVDRPFSEKVANFRYESAMENLTSQKEELAQLKKMYDADDITEETEEIVLRRQEFGVKTAELTMELQTASRDYTLDVLLPRNDETYSTMLEQAKIALEQAKTSMENGITRGKYDLEKKREARAASLKRHAKLLSDRELMTLRAPADGTVYYGRNINGEWAEIVSMTSKLSPYSNVAPNSVLMTIVKQRPLNVLTSIPEKDLPDFKSGQVASITPTSDKDVSLSATVSKIGTVPGGNKKFELHLDLENNDVPEWLVAGMTCAVKVRVYENEKALLIPTDMVQTDEEDKKQKYVMLLAEDDQEPTRRDVKLGRTKDKMVEVLEGLKESDKIVKEEKKDSSE